MAKVNVFEKELKGQGQTSQGQKFWIKWKILSEGIYIGNMKGLALTVQKLWPRLKFFKRSSKVKVKGH